jgi:hypothetical protein
MMDGIGEFYTTAERLDQLKGMRHPTDTEIDEVMGYLVDPRYSRYFFRDLDNAGWLQPLYERGVFRSPPGIIEETSGAEVPFWDASWYLVRVASQRSDIVKRIAWEVDTDNPSVHLNLIRAARTIAADDAAELAPVVVQWLSASHAWVDMLAEVAQDLMVHLVAGGHLEPALNLLEALTEPEVVERLITIPGQEPRTFRQVKSRCSAWYLKRLIEERLTPLLKVDVIGVAKVLESQLRKSIALERAGRGGSDSSLVWRPAIEDHPQNWGDDDLKTILTVGLRQALERAARDQPGELRPMLECYLGDSLSVFRRLGLHVLRVSAPAYQDLLSKVLGEETFAHDHDVHHEYYLLLQSQFARLPRAHRKRILDRVEEGPEIESYKRTTETATGSPPSDEEVEMHRRRWQLRQLAPLADALTGDWRRRYDLLVADFGPPEHPEFLVWSSATWVGPTSPEQHDELARRTPSDVLNYVKTFEPRGDAFDHSREGLGREFEVVVKDNPEAYIDLAARFITEGVHPTYVYHLVRGFHEAWKAGVDLDWTALVSLFEPISAAVSGEGPPLTQHEMTIDDVSWVGVRMAVSRFLSGALHEDDRLLPATLMPSMREVLLGLLQDPDPSRDDEVHRHGGAMDWVSIRINSARGVAAEAFLTYALRYARMNKAMHEGAAAEQDQVQRMEPSVKAAFTDMLDKEKEPSAAVHTLFGQFLPNFLFLDRVWIISQLDKVFPLEAEKRRYWEAAWEGYMLYCPRVYPELYELLRPQYHRAVAALPGADTSTPIRNTAHALAQHIALSYRMGYEKLEPPTYGTLAQLGDGGSKPSLLRAFLQVASDELRAAFVRGLGSSLGLEDDVPPEHWNRMRDFWQTRTQALPNAPSGYGMDQELSAFVSWVRGVPEDLDILAPLLRVSTEHLVTGHDARDLLAYLSDQSRSHPLHAVRMLRVLLDREAVLARGPDPDKIYLIGAEQHIWTILENAMGAEDAARELAVSLINLLGERGDYTYRQLLKPRH